MEKENIEYALKDFTNEQNFPMAVLHGWHDQDFWLHSHRDFSELVIVMSGDAVHVVDGEEFYVKKGDVFVVHCETKHGYRKAHDFAICNIMYRNEEDIFQNMDITQTVGYHALFYMEPYYAKAHQYTSHLTLSGREYLKVTTVVEQMIEEYEKRREGRKTLLWSQFYYLATLLSRWYPLRNSEGNTIESDVVKLAKVAAYIETNYRQDLSVKKLAEEANYSERHFVRIFKEAYQTTPLDYIISMRIRYACERLLHGKESVCEVAIEAGFSSPNYFSRVFRERMGKSPREYRKIMS